MKGFSIGPLSLLSAVLLLLSVAGETAKEGPKVVDGSPPLAATEGDVSPPVAESEDGASKINTNESEDGAPKNENNEKFLFGSYSTTTYTVVTASTSTVFYTCLSGTKTDLCNGRRKRKAYTRMLDMQTQDTSLDGTLSDDYNTGMEKSPVEGAEEGKDKFAFTVWTTSKTTTSVTVYYTNTSSTVKVSYVCLAGGISLPAFKCG